MGAGLTWKSQHNYTCNSVAHSHHNLPGCLKHRDNLYSEFLRLKKFLRVQKIKFSPDSQPLSQKNYGKNFTILWNLRFPQKFYWPSCSNTVNVAISNGYLFGELVPICINIISRFSETGESILTASPHKTWLDIYQNIYFHLPPVWSCILTPLRVSVSPACISMYLHVSNDLHLTARSKTLGVTPTRAQSPRRYIYTSNLFAIPALL